MGQIWKECTQVSEILLSAEPDCHFLFCIQSNGNVIVIVTELLLYEHASFFGVVVLARLSALGGVGIPSA